MVTMQDCERVWQRFDRLKEEAEQYMFPSILVWDLKITPLYKDLQENWDEHHGEIFMRVMIATLKQFGIDYDPKTEALMCDFCEKFDFGTASCVVDRYGASIVMAGGSFRFPEHQQFLFCPKCGASRLKKNILPPMEERKCPSYRKPQPFILS